MTTTADFPDIPDFLDRRTPTARQNVRPLDAIAADIHKVARNSVFEIGDLLTEARAACEPGTWLRWLKDEFEWSDDTADRYMKVVELGARFRNLRNLKLAEAIAALKARKPETDDEADAIVAAIQSPEPATPSTEEVGAPARRGERHFCWQCGVRAPVGEVQQHSYPAYEDVDVWLHESCVAAFEAKEAEAADDADADEVNPITAAWDNASDKQRQEFVKLRRDDIARVESPPVTSEAHDLDDIHPFLRRTAP